MPDEVHLREFLEYRMEALDVEVISFMLEVDERRYTVLLGDLGDELNWGRVAIDMKLLLANAQRPHLQIFLDRLARRRNIGKLVGEVNEFLRVMASEVDARLVPSKLEAGSRLVAGRQQDGLGNAHLALVRYQCIVTAPTVVGVLMNIDDAKVFLRLRGKVRQAACGQGEKLAPGEEFTGMSHWLLRTRRALPASEDQF